MLRMCLIRHLPPQVWDPRRDAVQPDLQLVCIGASLPPPSLHYPNQPNAPQQANNYIASSILTTAMEDLTFHIAGIKIVNVILNYFYVGLLIMYFILSRGHMP
ncbi:hypothetical protein H0H92_002977 [Tricholoma furcatifolium]|nr:hypothetical protein H0H92_002977 [Tricholoma furcatifolium]